MEIFAKARRFMAFTGNPEQWSEDYPGRELLLNSSFASAKHLVWRYFKHSASGVENEYLYRGFMKFFYVREPAND